MRRLLWNLPLVARVSVISTLLLVLPLLVLLALFSMSQQIMTVEIAHHFQRELQDEIDKAQADGHPIDRDPQAFIERRPEFLGLFENGQCFVAQANEDQRANICSADFSAPDVPLRYRGQDGTMVQATLMTVQIGDKTWQLAQAVSRLTNLQALLKSSMLKATAMILFVDIGTLLVYLSFEFGALRSLTDLLNSYTAGQFTRRPGRLTGSREVQSLYKSLGAFRDSMERRAQLERLKYSMDEAAKIQQSLLPGPLDIPGGALAATMEAAQEVGGDFYDYFWLDDGRLGFVIADVSDKGVGAALFGMRTSALIRAFSGQNLDPGQVLGLVNQQLCAGNEQLMFTTAILGFLDTKTGDLEVANAGHEPFYLVDQTRGLTTPFFDEGKTVGLPPLGLFSGSNYNSQRLTMQAGQKVVLYTDGANEAEVAPGQRLGQSQLQALVLEHAGLPLQIMVKDLTKAVHHAAAEGGVKDDLSFLAIGFRL